MVQCSVDTLNKTGINPQITSQTLMLSSSQSPMSLSTQSTPTLVTPSTVSLHMVQPSVEVTISTLRIRLTPPGIVTPTSATPTPLLQDGPMVAMLRNTSPVSTTSSLLKSKSTNSFSEELKEEVTLKSALLSNNLSFQLKLNKVFF